VYVLLAGRTVSWTAWQTGSKCCLWQPTISQVTTCHTNQLQLSGFYLTLTNCLQLQTNNSLTYLKLTCQYQLQTDHHWHQIHLPSSPWSETPADQQVPRTEQRTMLLLDSITACLTSITIMQINTKILTISGDSVGSKPQTTTLVTVYSMSICIWDLHIN